MQEGPPVEVEAARPLAAPDEAERVGGVAVFRPDLGKVLRAAFHVAQGLLEGAVLEGVQRVVMNKGGDRPLRRQEMRRVLYQARQLFRGRRFRILGFCRFSSGGIDRFLQTVRHCSSRHASGWRRTESLFLAGELRR